MIRAKGDALRDNRQLVALPRAERWNDVMLMTMLLAGLVPFPDVALAV